MKKLLLPLAVLIACTSSSLAGYWFGFREGWYLGIASDYLPRGSIATYQLEKLRAGKPNNVITGLEFDVDSGLLYGHELLDHPLRDALRPIWGMEILPEYEKYLAQMANYRKKHLSPYQHGIFDQVPQDPQVDPAIYEWLAQSARINTREINAMVEKYAR